MVTPRSAVRPSSDAAVALDGWNAVRSPACRGTAPKPCGPGWRSQSDLATCCAPTTEPRLNCPLPPSAAPPLSLAHIPAGAQPAAPAQKAPARSALDSAKPHLAQRGGLLAQLHEAVSNRPREPAPQPPVLVLGNAALSDRPLDEVRPVLGPRACGDSARRRTRYGLAEKEESGSRRNLTASAAAPGGAGATFVQRRAYSAVVGARHALPLRRAKIGFAQQQGANFAIAAYGYDGRKGIQPVRERAILPLSLICLILVIFAIIVYVTHPSRQVWARSAHGASRTVKGRGTAPNPDYSYSRWRGSLSPDRVGAGMAALRA